MGKRTYDTGSSRVPPELAHRRLASSLRRLPLGCAGWQMASLISEPETLGRG
jgi:hypothetical protein